ncbi:MAG: acetate--CoA ligase [Candidatus Edwardsbacteria bacterium]|nr:acetate--CoA ligase [Candidatus Edwardsbacteria bacterium]MBU1575983.1 acetate--CoA ligase [Candidatus Edwardsbacteria bacterium]MBU2464133.1 acetate--CoA ligase [Candidatus Edwardsbacteria bacterium]MBU2595064.1 acetate--CoA ligase [Candidatus Edwardsbacteria bacterium]
MSNIGSYEDRYKSFDWKLAEQELEYGKDGQYNIGYYCSDRICDKGLGSKLALIWEGFTGEVKKYTYDDIRAYSNTTAKFLQDQGVKPGDRVCLFMDKIPELYICFLGILKMGGIAQPLFSAFGEEALITRLDDAKTKAVLTTRKHAGKVRRIRKDLPELATIIIVDADDKPLNAGEAAFAMEKLPRVEKFDIVKVERETASVLHYTSGTTGKPKGAQHVHNSLVAQYITAKWVLDLKADDIYWCTADPGWVTGTSYGIIGAWSNGVTQVVLDAGFSAQNWYAFIERMKVTMWYSAPTAIRMLMKEGFDAVKKHDLTSLRHLASVGEPLNAEAVIWSEKAFGQPFYDTFWQTETGAMMICNYPGMKVKPGSMGKPFPGIIASVVNPKTFEPVDKPGTVGLIAFRPGWPSMMRAYWNNKETYDGKFKNGWYLSGDRSSIDADGYYWFVGRDDDVINTAGHLVGPFEIESALLEHPAVAESAAVGKPDPINMEVVKAFIALKPGFKADSDLEMDIMNFIRKKLSPLAMPQEIEFMASMPKTRSGKIMRRMLRAKEWGEEIGDISTLEND